MDDESGKNLAALLARLESNVARLAVHEDYAELVDEMRDVLREMRSELGLPQLSSRPSAPHLN